jgi:hypothetical protein
MSAGILAGVTTSAVWSRLHGFWEKPVFSVGTTEYRLIDVVLSAMARGDWSAFERRLAEGLACDAHAAAEGSTPSADELETAATNFRYDRDLISGAEINDWLARSWLSAEDWTAYLRRNLLRERWQESLEEIIDRDPPSAHQLAGAALAEGMCSGQFESFDAALAARVALVAEADANGSGERVATASHDAAAATVVRTHAHWLTARPAGDTRTRLDLVLGIEARFDETSADLVARAPLAEIVDHHRRQWQQIELDTMAFPTEHAAREAILCMTVDRRRTFFEDEIEPEQRDRLMAIAPGGVTGPIPVNGHFDVTAVVRRSAASLSEPLVAQRARAVVIEAAIRRAVRDRLIRRPPSE